MKQYSFFRLRLTCGATNFLLLKKTPGHLAWQGCSSNFSRFLFRLRFSKTLCILQIYLKPLAGAGLHWWVNARSQEGSGVELSVQSLQKVRAVVARRQELVTKQNKDFFTNTLFSQLLSYFINLFPTLPAQHHVTRKTEARHNSFLSPFALPGKWSKASSQGQGRDKQDSLAAEKVSNVPLLEADFVLSCSPGQLHFGCSSSGAPAHLT